MKLLNFLGAIGLMLGATTNIHNIRPNFLKSQSRQVQSANQELFDVESDYLIHMAQVKCNVFNSYDYVIFDLQNGDIWQSDSTTNKSVWVQDDVIESSQALCLNDYSNYLSGKGYSTDLFYANLIFYINLYGQSQEQGNYIDVYLFSFDDNGQYIEFSEYMYEYLFATGDYSLGYQCKFEIDTNMPLENLFLAFEYYSVDRDYGWINVDFDTVISLEDLESGDSITDIVDNSYNYFIFNNSEVANDNYDNGYDNGFSDGVEDGRQTGYNEGYQNGYQAGVNSQENLQLQIEDLTNQLNAEKTKVNNLQNQLDSAKVLQSTFDILTQAFNPVIEFFKIQITPNINVGSILLIPVSVAIILFLLKALIL